MLAVDNQIVGRRLTRYSNLLCYQCTKEMARLLCTINDGLNIIVDPENRTVI